MFVSALWSGRWRARVTPQAAWSATVVLMAVAFGSIVVGMSSAAPSNTSPVQILGAYPKSCLKTVARPSGSGRIAAVLNHRVTIASPAGGKPIMLPASFPLSDTYFHAVLWSPDGKYLATGDGRLWTATGHPAGRLFTKLDGYWSWSPTADCVLGVTSPTQSTAATLAVGTPGQPSHPLLRMQAGRFVFAPNGRTLVLSAGPPAQKRLMRLDLSTGKPVVLERLPAGTTNAPFAGWVPGGHVLLYWAGPGASIFSEGWMLSSVNVASERAVLYGTKSSPVIVSPYDGFVAACGRAEFAIVGGGRPYPTIVNQRLAVLVPGQPAKILTPKTLGYLSPACSASASSIAVVQFREGGSSNGPARLTLLSTSGAFERYLTPGGAFTDANPEWAKAGIVLSRTPVGRLTSQLWFIPGGRTARDTGLRATAWAWSAVPPTGLDF